MSKHSFIIVSNRLPVSVTKIDGKLVFNSSPGGLAKAMSSLGTDTSEQIWVGWPGIGSDELTSAEKLTITRELRSQNCVPVFLTEDEVKNFYEGYANDTIWPLFHYFQSYTQFDEAYWLAYKSVNALFNKAIVDIADPQATVWIHDYHLMLLPRLVRESLPKASICFFLHIPFPSFEIFRLLPNRQEILEGLLGADLVGFHTYDYAQYFLNSVRRTLGYESHYGSITFNDRVVSVDAFPIGIDYQKFTDALDNTTVEKEIATLDNHYRNQKIILSVDRLDYTKGIPHRLRAFEEFLKQNPKYHKKVSLIVIAVPSRMEVQTYKDLRDNIEQIVSRINGDYASVDWTPISYQFKNLPFEQVVALYVKANIALVTPLRDGMNLVAKEYVACKQDTPGVLILSELAGAADELQESIRINPNDLTSMVTAIKDALAMPVDKQRQRMHAMQKRIAEYTIQHWANDMMEQLAYSKELQNGRRSKLLSSIDRDEIITAFDGAKRKALFLDYDGTLTNFVSTPEPARAAPSKALRSLLYDIAVQPHTEVYIISGRTREALDLWFHDMPMTLIAEHGAWIRQHGKWVHGVVASQEYKLTLKPLIEYFVKRTPGARFEEKDSGLAWHYRNVSPELAYARNARLRHELNTMLADRPEIGVFSGHKVIEIKPRIIRKSVLVKKLLAAKPADFILCAGDDYTDEDMFEALPRSAYTIRVGFQETHARFQVLGTDKLRALLKQLLSTPTNGE